MIGVFKKNNPYNNFLLLIYGLILKIPGLVTNNTQPVLQEMDGNVFRKLLVILEPAGSAFPYLYSILSFALVYSQAVMLNKFVKDNKLMQSSSYLVGMSYLLITSLFPEWQTFSSPLIVNSFLIAVLLQLSTLFNSQRPKTTLFNIGLMIGVASFFYFPSISFLLLLIAGLIFTRPFRMNEWMTGLMGVLTPYYFLIAWLFITDRFETYRIPAISVAKPFFKDSTWSYIAIGMLSVLMLVGFFFIRNYQRRQLVQTRKIWGIVFLYLIVSFVVPFINVTERFDYWILMAVPSACIAAAAFLYPERRWFGLFFHWGLVALSIVMGYVING